MLLLSCRCHANLKYLGLNVTLNWQVCCLADAVRGWKREHSRSPWSCLPSWHPLVWLARPSNRYIHSLGLGQFWYCKTCFLGIVLNPKSNPLDLALSPSWLAELLSVIRLREKLKGRVGLTKSKLANIFYLNCSINTLGLQSCCSINIKNKLIFYLNISLTTLIYYI